MFTQQLKKHKQLVNIVPVNVHCRSWYTGMRYKRTSSTLSNTCQMQMAEPVSSTSLRHHQRSIGEEVGFESDGNDATARFVFSGRASWGFRRHGDTFRHGIGCGTGSFFSKLLSGMHAAMQTSGKKVAGQHAARSARIRGAG